MILAAPIRVVFCITELDPGGAERALTQLVLNLDRAQWQSHVICLGPRGHFADVLENAKIPVRCLNATGAMSFPRVLFQLTRELYRLRPAIVQSFLFHANIVTRIAARLAGIRLVVSGLRVAERRGRWHGRIDKNTNFLVTTNVCVSQGVADHAAKIIGLERNKLVVIPNAVVFDVFANARPAELTQLGIPFGSRVLISIGRFEYQKGFDVLLDAIGLLKPVPVDVYFLLVGDGPDKEALRAQVERNHLSGIVRFADRRNDVPELIASSCGLVLSSRWEGMPNVVLEAMAGGKPVIATRVEGIPELVCDGANGFVVTPDQHVELATAIDRLLKDPEFCRRAGKESQGIIIKEFTPDRIARQYCHLYRQLLNRGAD